MYFGKDSSLWKEKTNITQKEKTNITQDPQEKTPGGLFNSVKTRRDKCTFL
jgi:hypothetical protein